MKFQLKALVAALAIVAAVPANAAMNTAAGGDSSLILTLLDNTNAPISATFDLGPTFTTFDRTANQTWNLVTGNDGLWASAWNAFIGAAGANKQWGVYMADSFGGTAAGDLQRLVTAGTSAGINVNMSNSALASSGSLFDGFITQSNNVADNGSTILNNHGSVANGANFVSGVPSTNTASAFNVNGYSTTGKIANASADTNGAFDTDLFAYTITRAGGTLLTNTIAARVPTTDSAYAGAFFNLSSAGVLTYTAAAAAPIPEPETYGMLLAGLGMIGFVARRRKSA